MLCCTRSDYAELTDRVTRFPDEFSAFLAGQPRTDCLNVQNYRLKESERREIARILARNESKTKTVVLTGSFWGADGVLIANAMKTNTSVQLLWLEYTHIGLETGRALGAALPYNTSMTNLNLSANDLSGCIGELAAGLGRNQSLTNLDLSSCRISEDGGKALGDALHANKYLSVLNLIRNDLGDRGTELLAVGLAVNTHLKILDLGNNRIQAPGGAALGQALSTNGSLRELYLSVNSIGDEGGRQLAVGLVTNSSLTGITIGENAISASVGREILDRVAHNRSINRR